MCSHSHTIPWRCRGSRRLLWALGVHHKGKEDQKKNKEQVRIHSSDVLDLRGFLA